MKRYSLEALEELIAYLRAKNLPEKIEMEKGTIIANPSLFIESHYAMLKQNYNKTIFEPAFERLYKVRSILEEAGQGRS